MKKLLFLLLPILCFSQTDYTISPHYGQYIVLNGKFMQQDVTYNDFASVVSHFSKVLQEKMNLTEESVSDKSDSNGNGIYTYIYSERLGVNQPLKKIVFNYKIVNFNDNLLVESINIKGDFILTTKFYVRAFQTDLNIEETKNGIMINNYGALDLMTFQYKNKLGIINITNRQIKNTSEFEQYRENSKQEYLSRKAESKKEKAIQDSAYNAMEQRKEQERSESRLAIEKKNSEPKILPTVSDVVYATKKTGEISINNKYSPNVSNALKDCLKSEKNGVFSVYFKNINAENPVCENVRRVK